MAKHPGKVLAGSSSSRTLLLCVTGTALAVILGFLGQEAVAFESFSTSFTFGSVPGGEPRFNFNGFNPGVAGGQQGRGVVDNEGYYKVGVTLLLLLLISSRSHRVGMILVHTADMLLVQLRPHALLTLSSHPTVHTWYVHTAISYELLRFVGLSTCTSAAPPISNLSSMPGGMRD